MAKTKVKQPVFIQRTSVPVKGKLLVTFVYKDGTHETKWVSPRYDYNCRSYITVDDFAKSEVPQPKEKDER